MPRSTPLTERFAAKWQAVPNGCWEWTAGIASNGYGMIGVSAYKTDVAHRVSWRLYRGEIPPGLFVLHKCDNRRCVNPDHLYLGTVKDNSRDLMERGKPVCNIRENITPEVEARRVAALPRGDKWRQFRAHRTVSS